MHTRLASFVFGLSLSIATAGCGGSSTCVVGSTQACLCVGGGSGVQLCVAGGTYGACMCGGVDGGPGTDAGPGHDAGPVDLGGGDTSSCDSDGDGHTSIACGGDDCDDSDGNAYPTNLEICDASGHDEDCNPATLGPDSDGDGPTSTNCCNHQLSGSMLCGDDCNDMEMDVHPGAPEACDGLDNDCNGMIDDGLGMAYYADCDRDGYGGTGPGGAICAPPTAPPSCPAGLTGMWISTAGDCNDALASVHPGATEACNMADDNCNAMVDEGAGTTWYRDLDHDGQGALASGTVVACLMPVGYAPDNTDCNDMCASCYVGATEVCDTRDNDCNMVVDDIPSPPACMAGVGACQRNGFRGCDGVCSATPGAPDTTFHTTVAPNGSWDWNCDGVVNGQYNPVDSVHHDINSYCGQFTSSMTVCTDSAAGAAYLIGGPVGAAPYCGEPVRYFYPGLAYCLWDSSRSPRCQSNSGIGDGSPSTQGCR